MIKGKHAKAPYLFLVPFFVIFIGFWLGPLGFSAYLSTTRWSGVGRPVFEGLGNFTHLFRDELFLICLRNTLLIAAGSVFIIIPLALFLAVLLNKPLLKLRNGFRLSLLMPAVMSLVVASLVFMNLFDYNYGLLRYLLDLIGVSMPDVVSSKVWALPMLIGILTWRWTGYNMLFFLAALQSVPEEVLEAARIDGASRVQSFWHVTLPILKPVTVFVMVQALIGSFQVFEEPLIITGGGPAYSTLTMALYLYNKAFRGSQFGYASAIALVQFIVIGILCVVTLKAMGEFKREA
jgi:ABC-type sugar transport system permease subunit